jgi:hypothetical protein
VFYESPKPPEADPNKFVLSAEWQDVVTKIFVAARFGHTPDEFFGRGDRLAGLREGDRPPRKWWKNNDDTLDGPDDSPPDDASSDPPHDPDRGAETEPGDS